MKKLILILILLFSSGCAMRITITPVRNLDGYTTRAIQVEKTGLILQPDRDLIKYIIRETK